MHAHPKAEREREREREREMGKSPQCSKFGLNKGSWTTLEDKTLSDYIKIHGEGKWSNVAHKTGLKRCGKSCRLRWLNYLRPDIKRGNISLDEEELIIRLHKLLGNRWSLIAGRLPGRTDNEIKNYWNSNLAKKMKELQPEKSKNEEKPPITRSPSKNQLPPDSNSLQASTCVEDKNENSETKLAEGAFMKQKVVEPEQSDHGSWEDKKHSNFMMDFDVEEICKILDSDFTKFGDDVVGTSSESNIIGVGGGTGCKSGELADPSVPTKENWKCSGEGDMAMGLDFLPLPSFLDDWTEDDINIVLD